MSFNPKEHLTKVKGGKTYLKAAPRIQWFRDENPNGRIITEMLNVEPLIFHAQIYDNDGILLATGSGMAVDNGKQVWSGRSVEKAETAAIARALKHAGYGTEFALDRYDDDDDDYLADSPVEQQAPAPKQKKTAQAQEWTAKAKADFNTALSGRFPNVLPPQIFKGMKIKSFDELGTVSQAAAKVIDWMYDNCNPFVADVVRYCVVDGKRFLVFRADDEPGSRHVSVRGYGRSTDIKDWIGDYAYDALGFDAIASTPNKWLSLRYPLTVFYEAKTKDDGDVYYVATGLGHNIHDPAKVDAEGEVAY